MQPNELEQSKFNLSLEKWYWVELKLSTLG